MQRAQYGFDRSRYPKTFASVDKHRLDEELEVQADMVADFGEEAAYVGYLLNVKENERKVLAAKLDLDIRSDPKSYGIDKLTETAIKNEVVLNANYQQLTKEINELMYRADLARYNMTALDHRKRELEKLCDLDARGYYSKPTVPRMTDARDRRRERVVSRKGKGK